MAKLTMAREVFRPQGEWGAKLRALNNFRSEITQCWYVTVRWLARRRLGINET